MLLASGFRFTPKVSLPGKGLQTVLKLFWYAQLTLLTQSKQVLPGSGPLRILITSAQIREDASSVCFHLLHFAKTADVTSSTDGRRRCRLLLRDVIDRWLSTLP